MKRTPAVAGSFYPSDPQELISTIEWSFLHKLGPGKLPKDVIKETKRGLRVYISPHAGYIYSGPIASHVYLDIAEISQDVSHVVIIGPDHNGLGHGSDIYTNGNWVTPLGELTVDKKISKEIAEESNVAVLDFESHLYEHSIEVQLPFLQYVMGKRDFNIIAIQITMQLTEIAEALAKSIISTIQRNQIQDSTVIIATTDLNHYEPYEANMRKDLQVVEKIKNLDIRGVYNTVERNEITMCGYGPTITAMYIAKNMNMRPQVLKYANSGDTSGKKDAVVGYVSVKFSQ